MRIPKLDLDAVLNGDSDVASHKYHMYIESVAGGDMALIGGPFTVHLNVRSTQPVHARVRLIAVEEATTTNATATTKTQ